jgi:serine/threonine protein kinase
MLSKLGKYEIKSEIGSGAMGIVYLAEDPKLGRPVALKTTTAEVAGNPELLKRFYREAQAAAKLCHPNIVTIYEIDEANGIPFIAMEFLEGVNLQKVVAERRELLIPRKLQIMIDACKGLGYAHQHGVVHRDIKPGNIMLADNGQVKIVDFGIARVGVSSMTRTGEVLGTVMYMSPEQVHGQTVDTRSDLFSLGVVLFELLTYQSPFPGSDVPSILFKILNEPPELVSKHIGQCPPQLQQIVERALAKDRETRYQSAEDMAFELQRLADNMRRSSVSAYLEQGQRSFQVGDFTIAKESLQKVLEIDSSHELAQNLLTQVRELIQSRQRAQKIEQNVRRAKEAQEAEQYDEAVALLEEALRLDPANQEAARLKAQIVQQRERAQKIRRHIELAEKLSAQGDFRRAKMEVEAVVAIDPVNGSAHLMMDWIVKELAEQERQRQVQQYLEGARAQFSEKNSAKALEILDRARELDPHNAEVEQLTNAVRSSQEKEERRKLLATRLAEIESDLNHGQLDQAFERVEQALRELPDDPQILRLHTQVSRQVEVQKKRRYVDEQIRAARELLQKNQHAAAITILEKAIQSVGDDPRLISLVETVQEAQQESARESSKRQVVREANENIRARKFPAAIEALEKGLARVGQSPELTELLQFARERQAEQIHEEEVRRALSRAQNYLRDNQYEEAVQFLTRAQEELKSTEVGALLEAARARREDFLWKREEIIADALQLLLSGEPAKAVAQLESAPKIYFKNEEFQRAYSECRQGLDRFNFVRTATEEVKKRLAEEDISSAQSVLEQALKAYADEPALLALQNRVQEEELRLQREQRIKVLGEAQVALGHMEYGRVTELLTSVEWESAKLPELAAQAKSLLAEAERRARQVGVPKLDLRARVKRVRTATKPVPKQIQAKKPRLLIFAICGVVALALAALGNWYFRVQNVSGYVQLTATPWGQVTGVTSAKGEQLKITGETPLRVPLAPGRYNISIKNGTATGNIEVIVERGKVSSYNYTFQKVKVEDLVQKILSEY